MVNLTSVPPYRAPLKPAAAGAPLRRAAGYPVSINDSRPAMQRHFQAASLSGDGALQGPAVLPQLPELGLGRKLRQVADAASVTLADVTAAAAAEDAAAGDALAAAAVAAPPPACAAGPACLTPRGGFSGLDAPPAGALSLAVGPRHAVQTAGGAMMVSNLGPDGSKTSTLRTVALRSFFAGVAPSCTGVDDASAVYDKHAGRFVIAASCGGFGRLLIAVSSTSSAAGTWFLFGLIADAVDTKLECTSPREQALADYPQVGYNKDGLFVTYYSYCPSDPSTSGAMLVALPKFKAYQGAPNMYAAVYSAAEVAAAGGVPGGAGAVRQLQPVVPQAAEDVAEGVAYFVADVSAGGLGGGRIRGGAAERKVAVVAGEGAEDVAYSPSTQHPLLLPRATPPPHPCSTARARAPSAAASHSCRSSTRARSGPGPTASTACPRPRCSRPSCPGASRRPSMPTRCSSSRVAAPTWRQGAPTQSAFGAAG